MSEDAPHYGPMTEQRAREILAGNIQPDGSLYCVGAADAQWPTFEGNKQRVWIDGEVTADELEAIAWWMRNMAGKRPPLTITPITVRVTDPDGNTTEVPWTATSE
jgi:hypothetical protein